MRLRERIGVLRASHRAQRCTGISAGASTRRSVSSAPTFSAAMRVSATRSSHSHSPSTYDSHSPMLPRSNWR
jgi:hypothetical protein